MNWKLANILFPLIGKKFGEKLVKSIKSSFRCILQIVVIHAVVPKALNGLELNYPKGKAAVGFGEP